MGDTNQLAWVTRNRDLITAPVVEVGSRHYAADSSSDYRSLCAGLGYVGVDLSAGQNVDIVMDMSGDFSAIDGALGGARFGTAICASVLEHVENVWGMAQNISRLVAPGGHLFVSVPMTWRFHGYPSDYWRFTPNAVRVLFPQFEFDDTRSTVSSNVAGDEQSLGDPNLFTVRQPADLLRRVPVMGRLLRPRSQYHYVLVPTMINMVGIKR